MRLKACPICGARVIRWCKCPTRHSFCAAGHDWHTCPVHGTIVNGAPDHTKPTNECTCTRSET